MVKARRPSMGSHSELAGSDQSEAAGGYLAVMYPGPGRRSFGGGTPGPRCRSAICDVAAIEPPLAVARRCALDGTLTYGRPAEQDAYVTRPKYRPAHASCPPLVGRMTLRPRLAICRSEALMNVTWACHRRTRLNRRRYKNSWNIEDI